MTDFADFADFTERPGHADDSARPYGHRRSEPPPPLVGRDALLAALEARLAANGSAVLTGPSGIGKTALMETVGATAAARGELVLRAAGAETERWIPYAVLADLLDQIPPSRLAGLPEPHRSALHGILLRDRRAATAPGEATAVCQLAWRELLGRCATTDTVLVLIDDAQWLDTATVEAVRYAGRRLTGRGVRVVVAGRWPDATPGGSGPGPGSAGPGGAPPWSPTPTAVQLAVPPLAPHVLAELFEQYGLPARVATKLHADSGGNPYLALALGGAFTDRIPRHWRPAPLPQRVHALISERLDTLPAETRETLLMAAFATRPTVSLLLRAGRADAAHDIRLAAAAGLLVTEGGDLRFTPPAVGTVLAEYADPAHRAEVHTALATVVPDAAGRVRHRALAQAGPDAEVARSLVTAAEAASRQGSHRMAAELYLLAADRTPCELDAQRLEWLVAAAEAGASASLPELVHRAADAVLAADSPRSQRVRVRIALIDLSGQGLGEMDEILAAALLDAEGDPALMALVRLRLAWAALVDGQPERSARESERALAHARTVGDTATEAMALGNRAMTSRIMGHTDYDTHLEQALRLPQPPLRGWLHMAPRFFASRFAVFDDRLEDARKSLLRMLAMVERGSGEEVVHVLRGLSEVSVRMGRCQEALDFADRAVRIAEEASLSPGPGWYNAAVAELAGGSLARATGYAEHGLRASEQERDAIFRCRHLHVLGVARLRTGDLRGAVAMLRRIQQLDRSQGLRSPQVLRWHGDLASGLAALGEPDQAQEVVRAARAALGRGADGGAVTGQLDRAEAAVRVAHGEPEAALGLLRGAAKRFTSLGQPLETGHCLLEQARIERRRRRHSAARAAVDEALALFTRCGARPWAEQAGRSLDAVDAGGGTGRGGAETGAGGNGRVLQTPSPLTDSEERIAVLVGEGATNQEVATRMFLSVKTIEASLTRIYRKLGVRSRTQLSSWLRGAPGAPGGPGGPPAKS
ncbi:LuxR family transcriptional regulator [Streptomyces sp. N2-109]|uniref:LuxR family transcriptional regulator n=1 Tax=Streptomyces gossypii TaxID=2883101 RepID=A0ABT2JXV8_9ACTN|nr:LuxR family transcriptional regulator [Streptomyces gossypii]